MSEEISEDVTVQDAQETSQAEQPEPVETAEATTAETAEEQSATGEPEQSEKPKSGAEKRISQLVWEREEAKREAERLRQQLAKPQGDAPSENDFDNYEDYLVAKAAHQFEAKQREQHEAALRQHEQAEQARKQQNFRQQVQSAQERYDDFQQVAFNPNVPITPQVADLLATSEMGADLAYHLGKHPEVAAQLSQMDPYRAALELGKIEAKLELPKPKTVTNAPEPLAPINGAGAAATNTPPKDMAEYIKWRRNQLSA